MNMATETPGGQRLAPGTPCLCARNLEVRAGNNSLVRELDLSCAAPSFLAVMGPSGAGKTTLLKTLAGMVPPGRGSVSFTNRAGREISAGSCRCEVGLVFQHLRLAPNLSVLSSVLCGRLGRESWWRTLFGFAGPDRARALRLLEMFGLGGYGSAPVGKLSGGEKQRVAIIRSLMQSPCILLADEPVSHLDAALSFDVLRKLKELAVAESFPLCCVLHDDALARNLADAVLQISPELENGWSYTRQES